jgi:hypothetical protein
MSGFQTVKKAISLKGVDLTAFNEPISSSKFMDVGRHEVRVESVEVKDFGYGDNLVVTWANEHDASIKQFINLLFTDRTTGESKLSKKYMVFARLFTKDVVFRSTFFLEQAFADTSKFNALKGLKASITIAKGKKGYDIVSEPVSGGYVVVDVESKAKLIETVFMSLKDANDEAKNQGLKRAFNEIVSCDPIEAEVSKNEQLLRAALEAGTSATSTDTLRRASML